MSRFSLLALLSLFAAAPAGAHVRPHNDWTAEQAEAVQAVRGMTLRARQCTPLGAARSPGRYRHFRCVGSYAPGFAPKLRVRVRYVLHPLERFRGRTSRVLATNVRYDSFGVP